MDEKITLNYHKTLKNHIFIFKVLYFVLAGVAFFFLYRYKVAATALTIGYIWCGLLVLLGIWTLINSFNYAEYDKDSLTVKRQLRTKTINFKDLTAIKDTGKAIILYSGNKKVLKLSGLTYEVADLGQLVETIEKKDLTLEDAEKPSPLSGLFDSDMMRTILLCLGLANLAFMVLSLGFGLKSVGLFIAICLILPIFTLVYYFYLFIKSDLEKILGYRLLFFLNLVIPAVTMWIFLAKTYTFSSPQSIIVVSLIIVISLDILFHLVSGLLGMGNDKLIIIYLLVLLPLLLTIGNLILPNREVTTETETIYAITAQSSKIMLGYTVITEDDEKNHTHFAVPSDEIAQYKVDEKVTVTTHKGAMNLTYKEMSLK